MRSLQGLQLAFGVAIGSLLVGCAATTAALDAEPMPLTQLDEMGYERQMERIPDERVARLDRDLDWPVHSEAVRPERVAWMLDHIGWYVEDQANDLEANGAWMGRLLKHDLKRGENQLPRDAADWSRMLAGNPDERIPRHAVRMFY